MATSASSTARPVPPVSWSMGCFLRREAEIGPAVANQIYAGIAFDTKLFRVSHPERALKVCSELVNYGADPEAIADALFARESLETMVTLAAALGTLDLHCDGRVSTAGGGPRDVPQRRRSGSRGGPRHGDRGGSGGGGSEGRGKGSGSVSACVRGTEWM